MLYVRTNGAYNNFSIFFLHQVFNFFFFKSHFLKILLKFSTILPFIFFPYFAVSILNSNLSPSLLQFVPLASHFCSYTYLSPTPFISFCPAYLSSLFSLLPPPLSSPFSPPTHCQSVLNLSLHCWLVKFSASPCLSFSASFSLSQVSSFFFILPPKFYYYGK